MTHLDGCRWFGHGPDLYSPSLRALYGAPDAIDWGLVPQTTGTRVAVAADGVLITPDHLCPDLLRWSNIGPADGPRGRLVRGFFWLLRLWPPKGTR